jgi:hypothetical protein
MYFSLRLLSRGAVGAAGSGTLHVERAATSWYLHDCSPNSGLQWFQLQNGIKDPVAVNFAEPMDFGLARRLIAVEGLESSVAVGAREMRWRFTPKAAWKAGVYRNRADNTLEDIAGNRSNRAFDVIRRKRMRQGSPRQAPR